jgi:hypothetical protein
MNILIIPDIGTGVAKMKTNRKIANQGGGI